MNDLINKDFQKTDKLKYNTSQGFNIDLKKNF